jgi:hypothetical protein
MIVLGFYDGPTAGIVECALSHRVYRFEMLDWDDEQRVRIFRLAEMPPETVAECVAVFAPQQPKWPIWVPGAASGPEVGQVAANQQLETILASAKPPCLLAAWIGFGEDVLAARRLPPAELADAPDWFSVENPEQARDWFALLGLNRAPEGAKA